MDIFKLGLRNLLGITLPGGIIFLALWYFFYSLGLFFGFSFNVFEWLNDKQALIILCAFIISYILGNIFRLIAADKLDNLSSDYSIKTFLKQNANKNYRDEFKILKENFEKGTRDWYSSVKDVDEWIWIVDKFPYNLWEFRKFALYHPKEVLNFFEAYRGCMITKGKEFFNYCKMVIFSSSKVNGDDLKDEVYQAEANSRFWAGTFFALFFSICLLSIQVILKVIIDGYNELITKSTLQSCILPLLLIILMSILCWVIIRSYRKIRLKEVDTVYDAFYLVHRHPNNCSICSTDLKRNNDFNYLERMKLIRNSFDLSQKNSLHDPIDLKHLIQLMKERSKDFNFLSSIYFAGHFGDHPYFILNDAFAIGIAVLPEDEAKSSKIKRHPHQNEIIVVIEGSILLDVETNGVMNRKHLKTGDYWVLEIDQCHRILSDKKQDAVYLFLKTHPCDEPLSIDCKEGENSPATNELAAEQCGGYPKVDIHRTCK
jgi:quercetin dioxygenase-like cupin family protein